MCFRLERAIFGVACLIIVGGPVMLGFGLYNLFKENNHAQKVAAYNSLYENYTDTTLPSLERSSATIGSSDAFLQTGSVAMQGSTEGIVGTTTKYFHLSNVDANLTQTMSIRYTSGSPWLTWNQPPIQPPVPRYATVSCTDSQ